MTISIPVISTTFQAVHHTNTLCWLWLG